MWLLPQWEVAEIIHTNDWMRNEWDHIDRDFTVKAMPPRGAGEWWGGWLGFPPAPVASWWWTQGTFGQISVWLWSFCGDLGLNFGCYGSFSHRRSDFVSQISCWCHRFCVLCVFGFLCSPLQSHLRVGLSPAPSLCLLPVSHQLLAADASPVLYQPLEAQVKRFFSSSRVFFLLYANSSVVSWFWLLGLLF